MTASADNTPFVISRIFDAPRDLVFRVWTEPEHLLRWWGPKGFKMLEAKVDLRPDGIFHYGMQAPDGSVMWGKWTFREIQAPKHFTVIVSFSDEAGGTTRHPFVPDWSREMLSTMRFAEQGGKTVVTVEWTPHNPTEAEIRTFDNGRASMKDGWGGTFDQLKSYLAGAKA